MDHLQKLQIYVRVVETQSFTHTAETLGLHRPLISKAIKQLEDELGVNSHHVRFYIFLLHDR